MNPLDRLVAAYREFKAKGAEILRMRHDVTILIQQARAAGRTDLLPVLDKQASDLNDLYYDWVDADGRVQSIVGDIKSLGLPVPAGLGIVPLVIPAVMVAAIAAVIVTMTLVIGRYQTQKQLLAAIKAKLVTPEQAERLGLQADTGPFGDIKQILGLGAVVAALLILGPMVRDLIPRRAT